MKALYAFVLTVLACSCSKSGQVSTSELEGRRFDAVVDTAMLAHIEPEYRDMARGLAASKREYTFNKQGKGSLKANMFLFNGEVPFDWSIKGDSIQLAMSMMGQSSTDSYFIDRDGESFILAKKDVKMTLKPL